MGRRDSQRDEGTLVEQRHRTRRPRRFKVVLHNDNYTTMDFVVLILMKHFHKSQTDATHVMLQVHYRGTGVAGLYSREVAETKVAQVTEESRSRGMPLKVTSEPE